MNRALPPPLFFFFSFIYYYVNTYINSKKLLANGIDYMVIAANIIRLDHVDGNIRSTQWKTQHQKRHVKRWFFATAVAGAGKGNFQLLDIAAAVSL